MRRTRGGGEGAQTGGRCVPGDSIEAETSAATAGGATGGADALGTAAADVASQQP